jgi:hypothetical protein
VTPDTIVPYEASVQSWNRFSYCRNNPIIYNDPTGHRDLAPGQEQQNSQSSGFFSASSVPTPEAMKNDATKLVNNMFDKAVKDCKNLTGGARLKGVVENLTKQFESVKYKSEDQLAYTYGALMNRMGKEFGAGPNHIGYGQTPGIPLYDLFTGKLPQKDRLDCTFYQTLGINILGLTKPGGENVNERLTSKYTYKDPTRIDGPNNFKDNTSIFRKYNGSDKTGTIGLITKFGDYNHAFTSLNSNSSYISESDGASGGVRNTRDPQTIDLYKNKMHAEYYRLRLPDWKKQ